MHFFALKSNIGVSARLRKSIQLLSVFFALLVMMSVPAFSQVNLGRINGTVTDMTGGVVSGAMVTVLDVARGVPRVLTTDDSGTYSAPALIPGAYTVRVEAKGFSTVERKDVQVGVGEEIRVDVTLQPGEQTQLVTVTGEMPEVNTTNAELGGVINNQVITDLPVEGRTFLALANYRPGVMTKPGAGGGLIQYTNGMRADYNVFVFDGVLDVNAYGTAGPLNIGYQAGGPDESVIVSVDAIQEMNFVENPKAEYGWRPGAQVNIGLKSGTNTIHGTAFAVGRDTSLQARNPFFPTPAPAEYEQYGATVGGPIKKDKLFYLLSYEGQNYNVGNPKGFPLPTLASLGGNTTNSFPDAIAAMNKAGIPVSQLSLNLAGCTNTGAIVGTGIPCAPTGLFSNTQANTAQYLTDFPVIGNSKNGVGKFDYHINDKNNFNVDYFQGYGHVVDPAGNVTQNYWSSPILGSVSVGRVVWTYVPNTSVVNEVRTGWDYSLQVANAGADCNNPSAPNYTALGVNTGLSVCEFPAVNINGFGVSNFVLGQDEGIQAKSANYSFLDNLSYTRGNHLFKMGVQYTHEIFNVRTGQNLSKGTITFKAQGADATALEAFLNGSINAETLQIGNLLRTGYYDLYAAYLQDDWRVVPRLTLNLGLRWELETPFETQNNQYAIFNQNVPGGLQQENNNTLYHWPVTFGPRFGLAYDVTGKGTTVVHAGFNIVYFEPTAYDLMNGATTLGNNPTGGVYQSTPGGPLTPFGGTINVQNTTLTAFNSWAVNNPIFSPPASPICGPGQLPTAVTPTPPSPCKAFGVMNLVVPQFYEWNFGITRALTNSTTFDVSYVGNHGQHQMSPIDINAPAPGATNTAVAEQSRRPFTTNGEFPYFSNIIILSNPGRSNYNGLQASLTQRMYKGLTFTAGYTYQHSFDTETGEAQLAVPQNQLNPNGDYGNSSLDVRHRFTLQGTYQIPAVKAPAHLLDGWQVTSATQIFSALPFNAVDAGDDISGTGEAQDRWNLYGSADNFKANGVTPFPCYAISGSKFATSGCTIVGPVGTGIGAFPQPCQAAAPTTALANQVLAYGCYAEGTSAITPPGLGTFGNMLRYGLRGTGFRVWDMTLMKNIPIHERLTAQFRVECFNLLNTVQYAVPNANPASPTTFGAASGTPNIVANSPIIGNGDARRFQLGLRLNF